MGVTVLLPVSARSDISRRGNRNCDLSAATDGLDRLMTMVSLAFEGMIFEHFSESLTHSLKYTLVVCRNPDSIGRHLNQRF